MEKMCHKKCWKMNDTTTQEFLSNMEMLSVLQISTKLSEQQLQLKLCPQKTLTSSR